MLILKSWNLKNRNGNRAINQIVTEYQGYRSMIYVFCSYGSNISFWYGGKMYLNERYVKYSVTTSKYYNIFKEWLLNSKDCYEETLDEFRYSEKFNEILKKSLTSNRGVTELNGIPS